MRIVVIAHQAVAVVEITEQSDVQEEVSNNYTYSYERVNVNNWKFIIKGGEMASMMDEMAKTLARRRERQKDNTVSHIFMN